MIRGYDEVEKNLSNFSREREREEKVIDNRRPKSLALTSHHYHLHHRIIE